MITTPFLGLKVWNLTTDPYDSAQLASNWQKVDEHDHSNGKGLPIPTAGLQDGAVTGSKIAPGGIPTSALADLSVTTAKLADAAVTVAKLASVPLAQVKTPGAQNIPTTAGGAFGTAITGLSTVDFDTDGMHTANDRLTCNTPGIYRVAARCLFATSGAGTFRQLYLVQNAVNPFEQAATPVTASTMFGARLYPSTLIRLVPGNYVQAYAGQDSGGSLSCFSVVLSAVWVAP